MNKKLCISGGGQIKEYVCKTTHTSKPFLRVNSEYLDLTTRTTSGLQLNVKHNNQIYRPIQTTSTSLSSSYYTTSTLGYSGVSTKYHTTSSTINHTKMLELYSVTPTIETIMTSNTTRRISNAASLVCDSGIVQSWIGSTTKYISAAAYCSISAAEVCNSSITTNTKTTSRAASSIRNSMMLYLYCYRSLSYQTQHTIAWESTAPAPTSTVFTLRGIISSASLTLTGTVTHKLSTYSIRFTYPTSVATKIPWLVYVMSNNNYVRKTTYTNGTWTHQQTITESISSSNSISLEEQYNLYRNTITTQISSSSSSTAITEI